MIPSLNSYRAVVIRADKFYQVPASARKNLEHWNKRANRKHFEGRDTVLGHKGGEYHG